VVHKDGLAVVVVHMEHTVAVVVVAPERLVWRH
jgi:hypothetical protein